MKEHIHIVACDWCRAILPAVARIQVEVCKEHLVTARKLRRRSGSTDEPELVVEPIDPARQLTNPTTREPVLGSRRHDYWEVAMERILDALASGIKTGPQLLGLTKLRYSTLCRSLRHLTKEGRVRTTGHARGRRYEILTTARVPHSRPEPVQSKPRPTPKLTQRVRIPRNAERDYWPGVEAKVLTALGEIGDMTTKPIVAARAGLSQSTTYAAFIRLAKKGQVRMVGAVGRYRRYVLAHPLKRKAS